MRREDTILENANRIRAEVIGNAIDVEDYLTDALGNLYSPVKSHRLETTMIINDLIADLTFDKKIKLFKKFVDSNPHAFLKHPDLIKDLYEIKEKRNLMAHRNVSLPFIYPDEEMDEFEILAQELDSWKRKCDFTKHGKPDFSFSLQDLEDFTLLCLRTKRNLWDGHVRLLNIRPKEAAMEMQRIENNHS